MKKILILSLLAVNVLLAQRFGGRDWGSDDLIYRTAREAPSDSDSPTPNWTNSPAFGRDVFTFVRVCYSRGYRGSWSAGGWGTDLPDSDLNLSFRLQQMTSMKVDPDGRILRLTDPALFDFPWIYIVEPGRLQFEDAEVPILRAYLLNGGFLMADDFWGEAQWANFAREMKRVFPDREFADLPEDHRIFNCVFDLRRPRNQLQVPNIRTGMRSEATGGTVTWERHDGEECIDVHFRALYDDRDRMMVIACHNTDNGDGWEREGDNEYYFHQFSEKRAYPLAINILYYAMTH